MLGPGAFRRRRELLIKIGDTDQGMAPTVLEVAKVLLSSLDRMGLG